MIENERHFVRIDNFFFVWKHAWVNTQNTEQRAKTLLIPRAIQFIRIFQTLIEIIFINFLIVYGL